MLDAVYLRLAPRCAPALSRQHCSATEEREASVLLVGTLAMSKTPLNRAIIVVAVRGDNSAEDGPSSGALECLCAGGVGEATAFCVNFRNGIGERIAAGDAYSIEHPLIPVVNGCWVQLAFPVTL